MKFIISYDLPNKKWHVMFNPKEGFQEQYGIRNYKSLEGTSFNGNLIVCKCSSRYFDLILTPLVTSPVGVIFKVNPIFLNKLFSYKNVCLGCKRKVNLPEFKQWMIIQKLKYL